MPRYRIRDRAFAVAIQPAVGEGIIIALTALRDEAWAVRNSGTLLLAALLERGLRTKRSRDETAAANGLGVRSKK